MEGGRRKAEGGRVARASNVPELASSPRHLGRERTSTRSQEVNGALRKLHDCFEAKALTALTGLHRVHPNLSPHRPALIGVSGGRDSVALLHFLASQGWQNLIVCHLNHGLRGRESGQDAAFVRRFAGKLGLRCEVHREDIAALAKEHKFSIETAARVARDRFLNAVARNEGAPFVFLAHHMEDNAETVLGNLCRGSGLQGLSGMAVTATDAAGLVKLRPLLEVRRVEINAYIEAHALSFREDGSNTSRAHRRNRLRHEVLPLLREVCQRDVGELIARSAKLVARDEACLREQALRFAQKQGVWREDASLQITPALKALHPALLSRIVRCWLTERLLLPGIGHHEIEVVMGMLTDGGAAKVNLPGACHVRRRAKRLFVEGQPPDCRARG